MRHKLKIAISAFAGQAGPAPGDNPIPTLASISPTTANVGDTDTVITLTGTNYIPTTVAKLAGASLATTYVDDTAVTAIVPTASLVAAGTPAVTAFNPAPGGGTSGGQTFTISNPVPTLASISPTSVTAGAGNTDVTLTGTNYNTQTVGRVNGVSVSTAFVNSTTVTATVLAADLAAAGTDAITAHNPAPGGGTSASQTLTTNNPVPTLASINPTSIIVGSTDTVITLTGTNYNTQTVARRDGVDLATTYVSASSVTAVVPTANLASTGTSSITAHNPTPGGGTSGGQTLTVANPVPTTSSLGTTSGERWFATRTGQTINGTGFVAGATVTFGSTSGITPDSITSTLVTFTIPDAELDYVASKSVTVTNPSPGGGASNAQTYTVSQPAALRSFLIADSGNITIATGVSNWANEITDDGTKKNVVMATPATQPGFTSSNASYNNKGTVDFATSKYLRSVAWTTALTQPATTIVVGDAPSLTGQYFCDGISTNRQGIGQIAAANRFSLNAGTAINEPAGPTSVPKGVYVGVFNTTSSAGYRNGNYTTPVVSGNAGSQTLGGQTIGANAGNAGTYAGSTRMVAVFAGALTTTQMTQVAAFANRDCGA